MLRIQCSPHTEGQCSRAHTGLPPPTPSRCNVFGSHGIPTLAVAMKQPTLQARVHDSHSHTSLRPKHPPTNLSHWLGYATLPPLDSPQCPPVTLYPPRSYASLTMPIHPSPGLYKLQSSTQRWPSLYPRPPPTILCSQDHPISL